MSEDIIGDIEKELTEKKEVEVLNASEESKIEYLSPIQMSEERIEELIQLHITKKSTKKLMNFIYDKMILTKQFTAITTKQLREQLDIGTNAYAYQLLEYMVTLRLMVSEHREGTKATFYMPIKLDKWKQIKEVI